MRNSGIQPEVNTDVDSNISCNLTPEKSVPFDDRAGSWGQMLGRLLCTPRRGRYERGSRPYLIRCRVEVEQGLFRRELAMERIRRRKRNSRQSSLLDVSDGM